jgi:hypothetical protein
MHQIILGVLVLVVNLLVYSWAFRLKKDGRGGGAETEEVKAAGAKGDSSTSVSRSG